jgi:hypothetical protein
MYKFAEFNNPGMVKSETVLLAKTIVSLFISFNFAYEHFVLIYSYYLASVLLL